MKKIFASALMLTMLAGATQAHANWFWQHDDNSAQPQKMERHVAYTESSENKKWVYNGDNAYKTTSGQIAVQDNMNDGDNNAFIVHPTYGRLNASLRQGDTGQSMDTRVNQTFNN